MGATSSLEKVQPLHEFRKLNSSEKHLKLPVPPEERELTDTKGFVIFAILILILLPFLIYTLIKSDIRRISHGYDSCGDLCGVKNDKIEGIDCSGKDNTNKPFHIINILKGEQKCTSECPPGYVKDDNTCYTDDDEDGSTNNENLWIYYVKLWWKFILVILITTTLCVITLALFRFLPGLIVWCVLITSLITAIGITILVWFVYKNTDDTNEIKPGLLALAIVLTIFTVVIIMILFVLKKKIALIILLYKETAKAFIAMPLLTIFPVITLLLQLIVLALMVITTTYMGTSSELKKAEDSEYYIYETNGVFKFTIVFNTILTFWAIVFFSGCQYMILAGSVAQWYFKNNTKYPIITSFTNTLRFHLGTIAFGSVIITLMAVIKAIIKMFISNNTMKWLVNCICGNIEALLKLLSKNAYIETAIYGKSFLRSGKRATSLLISNAGSVIAVNSVGDFVLAMTQFLLLVISTGISYAIFMNNSHTWLATIFSFVINLIIVVVVFSVFETIVQTLFVCFCEDQMLNDGSEHKPYYMTIGFKKFINKSKQVYKKNT